MSLRTAPPQQRTTSAASSEEAARAAVRRFHVCDVLLPAALVLWLLGTRGVDPAAMDDWGLLRALPVSYFVALALLALSGAWVLSSRRAHPVRLGLHLVGLVLILHGTVPLIFRTPNYPWVYKHIGVVGYIAAHGSVDTSIDIYHNWLGFFALATWFGRLAGVESAMSYAAWAPVYFNLLMCLELSFVLRALPVSRRSRWLALFLFVPGNWVGQDYFAPQALAVVLGLGVFGMSLAWLRSDRPIRLLALLRRLAGRVLASRADLPGDPLPAVPADRRPARLCAIFGVFAFLVVAHQLTPYAVIVGLGLVSAVGLVRPRWVVLAMAAIAVTFLLLHHSFLARTENLLGSLFDILHNLNSNGSWDPVQPGRRLTALGAPALILGLWGLAGLGILRRLRAGRPVIMIALLAASPVIIAVAQSYGGEAVFRVYLFSLPWTVLLAACALQGRGRTRDRPRAVAVFGLLSVTSVLFMSAFFGSQELYRVREGSVDASRYFYEFAEPGSVLVLAAPHFPGRVAANYASFVSSDAQPNLMAQGAAFRRRVFGPDAVGELTRFADAQATTRGSVYFAVTADQRIYAEVLGLSPRGSFDRLTSAVMASSEWRVVCRNADAVLFVRSTSSPNRGGGTCRGAQQPFAPPLPSATDAAGPAVALPALALILLRERRKRHASNPFAFERHGVVGPVTGGLAPHRRGRVPAHDPRRRGVRPRSHPASADDAGGDEADRQGGRRMGQSSAETVKEIEEVRAGLDRKVQALEERLPAPATLAKRVVGIATGGGVGGTVFWFVVRRARRKRAEKQAAQTVVQIVPGRIATALQNGEWKPYAFAMGGVWLAVRLAERRQTKRMNKMLLAQKAA